MAVEAERRHREQIGNLLRRSERLTSEKKAQCTRLMMKRWSIAVYGVG